MNERRIEKLQRKFLREKLQRNFLFDGKKNIPNQVKQKTTKQQMKKKKEDDRLLIEEKKNSPEAVRKREERATKKAQAKAKEEALKQAESASFQEDDNEEEFPLLSLPEQEVGLLLEELVSYLRITRKENFLKAGGKIELSGTKMKELKSFLSPKKFKKLYKNHSESCIHLICEALKFHNKDVKKIGFSLLENMVKEGRFEVAIFIYIWSRDHVPSAVMRMMCDTRNIATFKNFGCDYWIQSSLKKQKENEEIRKLCILKIEDLDQRARQLEKLEERKELLEKLGEIYKI